MLAIYVAFSRMELFKPNKTAALRAFFRVCRVGNETVRDRKPQTGQTNGGERLQAGGGRGPLDPPAPSFTQEPEDQMPDPSIVLQIDI